MLCFMPGGTPREEIKCKREYAVLSRARRPRQNQNLAGSRIGRMAKVGGGQVDSEGGGGGEKEGFYVIRAAW